MRVDAVSVTAVDGSRINLTGGYDGSGKGRVGTIAGAWVAIGPFALLIKGNQVVLTPGVIFDAAVLQPAQAAVHGPLLPQAAPDPNAPLAARVLYDTIVPGEKLKHLPLSLRRCGAPPSDARVVGVDGTSIVEPIQIKLEQMQPEGACVRADGTIKMKAPLDHFAKGMNRFEVEAGGARQEVLLEIER